MFFQTQKNKRRLLCTFGWIISITLTVYIFLYMRESYTNQYHGSNHWRLLNRTAIVSDDEQAKLIAEKFPNVPIDYWLDVKNHVSQMFFKNRSCAHFPNIMDLDVNNLYWQTVHMSKKTTIELYNAFYDTRQNSTNVKILGMVNKLSQEFPGKRSFYCHLWFEKEKEPIISKINDVYYIWHEYWKSHEDGALGPYLMNCPVPDSHKTKIPKVVSLVENACDSSTNLLKIINNKLDRQQNFTVCVKGLDLLQVDVSVKLVEWIEVILLMGADKIHFYEYNVHTNVRKVLDYYKSKGKVDVTKTTLPPGNPNIPIVQHMFMEHKFSEKRLTELIPYNDCFYRNMYNYKYVVIVDVDEIIVPRLDNNWHELMTRIQKQIKPGSRYASYNARNVYFLDTMTPEGTFSDIPPYMHMLQHVYRSRNFTLPGWYVKSFFDTNETITCHNHLPISHTKGSQFSYNIDIKDAYMQHYRHSCASELKCDDYTKNPVKDTRLWDFKDVIIERVNKVFEELNFFSP